MPKTSSWIDGCMMMECPNDRLAMFAPLCKAHMLDAWRYVELHPDLKPSVLPQPPPPRVPGPKPPGPPAMPLVYYIRRANGRVKIGTTTNLVQRVATLGEAWPTSVLAAEPGGRETEKARHEQFAEHRHYSGASTTEEFDIVPRLLDHVAAVREEFGDPVALADGQRQLVIEWQAEHRRRVLARGPRESGDRMTAEESDALTRRE